MTFGTTSPILSEKDENLIFNHANWIWDMSLSAPIYDKDMFILLEYPIFVKIGVVE